MVVLEGGGSRSGELRVSLLGDFQLFQWNQPVRLRGRKARGLLAFLASLPNRAVARERAADLLWSDRGAEQARNSLRQTIAEIRAALPDSSAIVLDRDTIGFRPGEPLSDIQAIAEAAAVGDAHRLAGAIDEVGDTFLADLSGLSPAFDEWLLAERVRQTERLVETVLDGCGAIMASARASDIQTILRGLDRLDPWNEAVARLGLEADFAAGDMAALHRRYRRLEEALRNEFGIRPAEETRALFDRLSRSQPVSGSARTSGRPAEVAKPQPAAPPTVLVSAVETVTASTEATEIAAIVTDDIRTALAKHHELRVLSLDGSDLERVERFCADAVSTYMLSGRLRQLGDEIRINLLIGRADTGVVIWSHQFVLDRDDLADAVDQLVARAVGAAFPVIDRDLAADTNEQEDGDAVRTYIGARRLIAHGRTLKDVRRGVEMLEALIASDPRHLSSRLLLARMYNTDFWRHVAGHDVASFRARAAELTQQAMAIEPSSHQVQIRLAWCSLRERNWLRAEHGFRKALEQLGHDADSLNEIGFGLCHLGKLDEAEPLMQRAFTLNPFAPPDYHADYATLLMMRGDPVSAEEHFEVSGAQSSQYIALRLANSTAVPSFKEENRAKLRDQFRSQFLDAWQPERPPTIEDIVAWARYTLPFRQEAHAKVFEEGLTAAIGSAFPA
jgi:DNA-binding SARP family transcriptional activator/TolB-like protein